LIPKETQTNKEREERENASFGEGTTTGAKQGSLQGLDKE